MGSAGRFSVLAVFAIVSLLFSVITVQGQFTTLPYTDPFPPCYNGIKDANETGVDCGPACTRQDVRETCDTIDNDRDCLIDENCPVNPGIGAPGGAWGGGIPIAPQPSPYEPQPVNEPSCQDGIQNGEEGGIDCGGACLLDVPDVCDGKDNNHNCLVDEGCKPSSDKQQTVASCSDGIRNQDEYGADCGGICQTSAAEVCDRIDNDRDCRIDVDPVTFSSVCAQPEGEPIRIPATPGTMSEVVPMPEPMPAPAGSHPKAVSPTFIEPSEAPATPAEEISATPAPTPDELAALTDEELDTLIEQNDGLGFIKEMRKLADDKGIYVPKDEPDAVFARKYARYIFKHQSELAAKFEGKEPAEDDFVSILKQFSEEAYPKPVQTQSFFSKVAGFFKRIFG